MYIYIHIYVYIYIYIYVYIPHVTGNGYTDTEMILLTPVRLLSTQVTLRQYNVISLKCYKSL